MESITMSVNQSFRERKEEEEEAIEEAIPAPSNAETMQALYL